MDCPVNILHLFQENFSLECEKFVFTSSINTIFLLVSSYHLFNGHTLRVYSDSDINISKALQLFYTYLVKVD